ncbi:MAG: ABC transporter permease, partial [Bacteroidetes bacterium]|nr:ABC transporter permease [Bacteroidota bacterium]
MFRNYLKIALRQLGRQKFYSAIKIGGFALGIAACLLITLYIQNELSYDRGFPGGDRLYRVSSIWTNEATNNRWTAFQAPFAAALKTEFAEVEKTARIMPYPLFYGAGSNQLRAADKEQDSYEEGFTYADSSLPDMFQFKMIYGDRVHALVEPQSMILSKRKADKYFPGENPVGRLMYINDDKDHPLKVGGVMQDPPPNSHLQYDFYISLTGHELWKGEQQAWYATNYDTYVMLKPGADPVKVQDRMPQLISAKYWVPPSAGGHDANQERILTKLKYYLQPVSEIHLHPEVGDSQSHGDIRYVWMFGSIAVVILLLACINFVNLSTARSASRAREVGIRKVVGSQRGGLIRQFLLESVVVSFLSWVAGLGLARVLLPAFNRLAGTSMSMPWAAWWLVPGVLLAAVVVGVVAGMYPAFYLSAFRPVAVLKGEVSRGVRHSGLRDGLVIFQLAASVVLIVCTIVVYDQMRLILHGKMGFDKDQVMLIQGTGVLSEQRLAALKAGLRKLPGVRMVTVSDYLPVPGGKRDSRTWWADGRQKIDAGGPGQMWHVDNDYLGTLGIKLVEGRNSSPLLRSDSQAVVINQAMARQLGWEHAVGKKISNGGPGMPVIGVVEDFNYESVKQRVGPLVLGLGDWSTVVAVKTGTEDLAGLIQSVRGVWKEFAPQQSLRYSWLDEEFAQGYADVGRTEGFFTVVAGLAVVNACLGLLALSAYMAEQRRREV